MRSDVLSHGMIRAGCDRVHPFRDFVSGWFCRHGIGQDLVLLQDLAGVFDEVNDGSLLALA